MAHLPAFFNTGWDRHGAGPDHKRLYGWLMAGIDANELPAGMRLPSTRALAQELGIARNTVVHVYAQLAVEGMVRAGVGQGTFVADAAPPLLAPGGKASPLAGMSSAATPPRTVLSQRGARLTDSASAAPLQWGAFTPGVPDVRLFPHAIWARLQARLWRRVTPPQLSYATGGGDAGLRYAIAQHLREQRGMQCTPEQVVVTSGTQQSLHLVTQLLADAGDSVWMEDPGYWGARTVFAALGLKLVPVALDAQGLAPSQKQLLAPPRMMFVSPAHQYPLGVLMSQARRQQLLSYAALRGVWVLEDDYDSEFRYASRPLPPLQRQDKHGRVIYLGTFSKTLFPALRLAYIVLPPALCGAFAVALNELYREGQSPQQVVLARFMSEGHYLSHLRRMRGVYAARRQALLACIAQHFGPDWPVYGDAGGLHLVLGLPEGCSDVAAALAVAQAGVSTRALSLYRMQPAGKPAAARAALAQGLLLGYGAADVQAIPRHFAKLARVLKAQLATAGLLKSA